MKKYIIIAAMLIACMALCAAVRPQTEATEETTPAPLQVTAVSAMEPTFEGIIVEAETTPPAEEEKIEISQDEPLREPTPEPKPEPEEVPIIAEVQLAPEPEPEPVPEPTPASVSKQTVTDPQPGDTVYVPGFGWLECQGHGEVIYDESIYENDNKIGIMG